MWWQLFRLCTEKHTDPKTTAITYGLREGASLDFFFKAYGIEDHLKGLSMISLLIEASTGPEWPESKILGLEDPLDD